MYMYIRYNILGIYIYRVHYHFQLVSSNLVTPPPVMHPHWSSLPLRQTAWALEPLNQDFVWGHLVVGGRITKQQRGHMFEEFEYMKKVSGV